MTQREDFLSRNPAFNCGFILIERQNFPQGRHLFGSRAPVLTARRLTLYAGRFNENGDDVVAGDEILSVLMTDEAFAGLTFGSGAYAPPVTVDRAAGQQLRPYTCNWAAQLEEQAVAHITSDYTANHVRKEARRVRDLVSDKGYVPKKEGEEIVRGLSSQAANLFRNAQHALSEYAKANISAANSNRISMSAAVSHADGIIQAIRENREMIEDLRGNPRSNWLLREMTLGLEEDDPREMCIQAHQSSGDFLGHSDMPESQNGLSIVIGTPIRRGEDSRLNDEDRLFPDRECVKFRITGKEMILAIENGAHGDMVRCEIGSVMGVHRGKKHEYRNRWGDLTGIQPDTSFAYDDPAQPVIQEEVRRLTEELMAGASARKTHADLADRIERLADRMTEVAQSFGPKSEADRERIRDEVADKTMRQISSSRIREKLEAIRGELRITKQQEAEGPSM